MRHTGYKNAVQSQGNRAKPAVIYSTPIPLIYLEFRVNPLEAD